MRWASKGSLGDYWGWARRFVQGGERVSGLRPWWWPWGWPWMRVWRMKAWCSWWLHRESIIGECSWSKRRTTLWLRARGNFWIRFLLGHRQSLKQGGWTISWLGPGCKRRLDTRIRKRRGRLAITLWRMIRRQIRGKWSRWGSSITLMHAWSHRSFEQAISRVPHSCRGICA